MSNLVGVKSFNGTSYVHPEKVIAIQISPTGGSIVVVEGGAQVHSIESSATIAGCLKATSKKT